MTPRTAYSPRPSRRPGSPEVRNSSGSRHLGNIGRVDRPPPYSLVHRNSGYHQTYAEQSTGKARPETGLGDELGNVQLPDEPTLAAGRILIRDQWNTTLHGPLAKFLGESRDVRFHKNPSLWFLGRLDPLHRVFEGERSTTLQFSGVNTDQYVFALLEDACNIKVRYYSPQRRCGTNSPDFARKMVVFNYRWSWGFVSSCEALAAGVKSTAGNSQ